ncbi:MAG TPA: hypothetical protein VFT74_00060 [Isosphaeraceae bacterium]|nr:hypothetical protein [Isosphaeraceae bacterium]
MGTPYTETVTIHYNGSDLTVAAGDYEASLNGSSLTTIVYCVDLNHFASNVPYDVHTASIASLPNGGEISYLVNHEAPAISAQLLGPNPTQTAMDQSTGLQLAIWMLEYGSSFSVVSATPCAVFYANQYVAEAAGHSGSATYLVPDVSGDGQEYVVPGQGYTQGFWKNHPDAWPVSGLTIAGTNFTEDQLISLLKTPPKKGDASLILVHQLIAAELNIINGYMPPPEVVNAINQANGLLTSDGPGGFRYVSSSSADGLQMTALAGVLDTYNNSGGG